MRWYEHLYMGEKAKKKRFRIIRGIRRARLQAGVYVITPASGEHNILDIYPSAVLLSPFYRDKELLILGIAAGYREALEVARDIVDDMYRKTGGLELDTYLAAAGGKV